MQAKTKQWLMWVGVLIVGTVALIAFTRSRSHLQAMSSPAAFEIQPAKAETSVKPSAAAPSAVAAESSAQAASHAASPVPPGAKRVGDPANPASAAGPGHETTSSAGSSTPAPGGPARLPAPRPGEIDRRDEDKEEGGLTDRTGRGGNLARQLNANLVPLTSECIEMAQERNPTLSGMLAFEVHLVPIEAGKVLIASVELQENNEIEDRELFECIEQSTLSIEGLETSSSFVITIPIAPDKPDKH